MGGKKSERLIGFCLLLTDSLLALDQLIGEGPEDAVELTKKLLVLDPLRRLTAKEAIQHCYVDR